MGYLAQIPLPEVKQYLWGVEARIVQQLNDSIKELEELTGDDFTKYKTKTEQVALGSLRSPSYQDRVSTVEIRTTLNGLIMRLYATYFPDQPAPFSGSPSMIINQNQSQSQSQVAMVLDFQTLLDQKINNPDTEDEEKTFLQKIKLTLPSIKSGAELVSSVISIAQSMGLDLNILHKLFIK